MEEAGDITKAELSLSFAVVLDDEDLIHQQACWLEIQNNKRIINKVRFLLNDFLTII